MHSPKSPVLALVLLSCLPLGLALILPAGASTLRLISVAQPLLGEGRLEVRDVPYSIDNFIPGAEVELTCASNVIRNIGEDVEDEAENRNAASLFELYLKAGPVWNGKDVYDTLLVTLDATHVDSSAVRQGLDARPDSIVGVTALCIRINAARSEYPTKYLDLRVLGPARLQRFGGVFPVEHLALPTRAFDFGPPIDQETPRSR